MEKFIVIALETSSTHNFENCLIIAADTQFEPTHKKVFGPGSKEECEKWITANVFKGSPGVQNQNATQTDIPPNDWRVIVLGIYLLMMIIVSVISLAFLMRSDTDAYLEDEKTLRACDNGKFSNANCGNCNANVSNPANTNLNATTNANDRINTSTNVNANTNANINAETNNTNVNDQTKANVKTNTNVKTETTATTASNSKKETNTNSNTANVGNIKTEQTVNQKIPEITIPPEVCSTVFGLLSADAFVFLVVFFAGMLGAMIRAVYSFVNHLGQSDFSFKWTWYYLLLPFLGGALSLGIYFVLRGGFYGASFGKGLTLNIYSFAAFSALTGLFTANALEKLRLVAVTLLADVPPKVDNSKEVQKKNEEAKR